MLRPARLQPFFITVVDQALSTSTVPTLIETMRMLNGTVPLWAHHRARLERSCRALGIPFPAKLQVPTSASDLACRFELGADGVKVATREPGSAAPIRLITALVPHEPYPHKVRSRACFERAGAEARAAGVDDAILLTRDGWVAEGTVWTLCWWELNLLCAPPLELGVLPGVGRARLRELRRYIVEKRVNRRALGGVPVFLVNAVRGVVEVASWDGRPVPNHPETARLAEAFWP